ncbi:MAG: FAD-dependent oxidoreductase [Gammaproteobacteria bacterium]
MTTHTNGRGRVYPHLFSSLALGGRELRNRIALPATLTNYGANHLATERWCNFLIERARGGAGLIVSEVIAVDPQARANPAVVVGYDERNDDSFKRTAEAVGEAGACLLGQLWHPGRQQLWHPTQSPRGVSNEPDPYSWTVPHVMSTAEVRRLVDAYIEAAVRLAHCGFAGVELHGAHGYLITQFLSPACNTRDDEYGGSLENRARFVRDISRGIREHCGGDFVIGLKMPAQEGVPKGVDPDQAARITAHLTSAGLVDYFAYAQGNFSRSLEDHVPDLHYEPGHFVHLHRAMREHTGGVPVMALGRIGSPALAEQIIASGCADLVGLCRAQVSDAAFANKAREGREAYIRPCVFDNMCWGEIHQGKPLAEFHNPHLGERDEAAWLPEPAPRPRHVAIVGAGPAGLEAAWVAAARGHRVTLFGSSRTPGGALRLLAGLPGQAQMGDVVEYQLQLCREHGVDLHVGERVSPQAVAGLRPDEVLIATGAVMRHPAGLPEDPARIISARELADRVARGLPAGAGAGTAVLYDHDHTAGTYAVAEALAAAHDKLVLITPRTDIAQGVNYCSRLGVYRRLYGAGVEMLTAHEPVELDGDTLRARNVFSGSERAVENVSLVVYATPRVVTDDAHWPLEGLQPRRMGDCMSPRDLMSAIHEGHAAGNAV